MTKTVSKMQYYALTGVAILGFIFLFTTILFLKSTVLLESFFPGAFSGSVYSGAALLQQSVPFDDPLITTVPADQAEAERKTRVFVSSADPMLGAPSADVFVIFFADVSDPAVVNYIDQIETLRTRYGDRVSLVWKDFTQPNGATSTKQQLAHCLADQGLFWEFIQALPTATGNDQSAWETLATGLGADQLTMKECLNSRQYQAVVDQNYYYGTTVGVINGHTVFVNDRLYTEAMSVEQLIAKIDEVLATFN